MIPDNDKLWLGLIVGLVVPVAGYFLADQANGWIANFIERPFSFKESTVFLIAICSNMLPIGFFRRRYYHQALRGITVVTMLMAIGWLIKYGVGLL